MALRRRPDAHGLYDPWFEHDACGVGFVAHIRGIASHSIVTDAKQVLLNMTHRGAVGSDRLSGDGAGILTSIPDAFMRRVAAEAGMELPAEGFAVGNVFLPPEPERARAVEAAFTEIAAETGLRVLGFRTVPVNRDGIGDTALASEPLIRQVFVVPTDPESGDAERISDFERRLFVARKRLTAEQRGGVHDPDHHTYVCSLSPRVIIYKGMLMPEQLFTYFTDLAEPDYQTHLAMVHSRFSTNTFPSWDRAQPNRFMAHNGEINTLRGNINKMRAREGTLASQEFGPLLSRAFPVIEPDCSDSGNFDNSLELLLMAGRSLPESVMMMIPEAWENHQQMSPDRRAMYEYFSTMMEPWDGPASIAFTDGRVIGAVLDRNGLRPSRYYVTTDDRVIMASEVGVLPLDPQVIRQKGRLQPGRMFLVDFREGRIVDDSELKSRISASEPFRDWVEQRRLHIKDLPEPKAAHPLSLPEPRPLQRLFGYTLEHLGMILQPMATLGKEPLGSMGNDTPLAALSEKPRLLYDYFKQLFAQVTNPPIDSIREDIIMSLASYIGPELNLLEPGPGHAHRIRLERPVLTNRELAQLRELDTDGFRTREVDMTYPADSGEAGLREALDRICAEAEAAISADDSLIILSDRSAGQSRLPIGALMATGAVHQHLIRKALRTQIGIVVESGEPREVHHFCTLVGYGADAVNPWLAMATIAELHQQGRIVADISPEQAIRHYIKGIDYGMRKVFGKMGISTLDSYKGAQIFEAVGLSREVIQRCFDGTACRVTGIGFDILAEENRRRHAEAYPRGNEVIGADSLNPGDYQWRTGGEKHMWDPESVADLQIAAKANDHAAFRRFSERQNRRSREQATLRGLLQLKRGNPVPVEEVEPVEAILRRFATGAMSFGSISQEAHETLAIAMNRIGGKSNTGEGGEMPERFRPLSNGDSKRSAIKQVASGRFGVTIEYLTNADELQIKMAQGAKPGEGGELPGHKVFDVIAKTRYSTPGVGLISPPPHHDIYSIEDLAQLIFDLKNSNPAARVSVKLVSEVGVGTVAAGVAKAHADHILISGHDGGTGASPLTGIKHAGLPWELGLAETHQTLVMNDLRSRVVIQTDGQLKTGRDVIIAAMLGAEEFGFATGALIAVGCIMMRKCEKNTCPVGVATQDERLRKKFTGKPEHLVNYLTMVAQDVRALMAELGFRTVDEMVGRVDMLEIDEAARGWKSGAVDLQALLAPPRVELAPSGTTCCVLQEHGVESVLDRRLIRDAADTLDGIGSYRGSYGIRNTDRTTGTMLSHEIARRHGMKGLPEGSVELDFTGSAGQSFGAWLAGGVTMRLIGDANDYVGKGLSGGRIIIGPPADSGFVPEENIIIGNVALYGAISGELFVRGGAAERFGVRNSGADVVVEYIGDHGCEYMTGGHAVILGTVGRNFAAGMSGGIAWIYRSQDNLEQQVNPGMVELESPAPEDFPVIRSLLERHRDYTESDTAMTILEDWDRLRENFVRVISPAYRRVLELRKREAREAEAAGPAVATGVGAATGAVAR